MTSGYRDIQESSLLCPAHIECRKVTRGDHETGTLTRKSRHLGLRKVLEGQGRTEEGASGLGLSSQAGSTAREEMSLGQQEESKRGQIKGTGPLDGGEAQGGHGHVARWLRVKVWQEATRLQSNQYLRTEHVCKGVLSGIRLLVLN